MEMAVDESFEVVVKLPMRSLEIGRDGSWM
jgi:hypothetical protein